MNNVVVALLMVCATVVSGCGKKELPLPITSCMTQSEGGAPIACYEYQQLEEAARSRCNELEGKKTFQSSPCPTAGRLGRCEREVVGTKTTRHYYQDAVSSEAWCKKDGGQWIPN